MKRIKASEITKQSVFFYRLNLLLFEQLQMLLDSNSNLERYKRAFAVTATLSMLHEACLDEFVQELLHESKSKFTYQQLNFLHNISRYRAEDRGPMLLELMSECSLRMNTKHFRAYLSFFELRNACMHPRIKHSLFSGITLEKFLYTVCEVKNFMQALRYAIRLREAISYKSGFKKLLSGDRIIFYIAMVYLKGYIKPNLLIGELLKGINVRKIRRRKFNPKITPANLRAEIKFELGIVPLIGDIREVVLP